MSSFLFARWRKEKEREEDEVSGDHALSFMGHGWCITLVVMKGLLRHISHRDRVPPSEKNRKGRMGLQLTQAEGYWLFSLVVRSLLVIWSLSVWL